MTSYHKYTVHLTDNTKHSVFAKTPLEAKRIVWDDIKDGFTYGYHDWDDFNDRATVERWIE